MTTTRDWAVSAYLESGHVVARLALGLRFEHVRIYQAENGEILDSTTFVTHELPDPFERAACCLAGPLAEERLTGIGWNAQPKSHVDVRMAREALERAGGGHGVAAAWRLTASLTHILI